MRPWTCPVAPRERHRARLQRAGASVATSSRWSTRRSRASMRSSVTMAPRTAQARWSPPAASGRHSRFTGPRTSAARRTPETSVCSWRGDYVAFLDSDDWWKSDKLERSLRRLDAGVAVGLPMFARHESPRHSGTVFHALATRGAALLSAVRLPSTC